MCVIVCDAVCHAGNILLRSQLTTLTTSASQRLKSRHIQHFYILPAKVLPLRGGETSGVNEALCSGILFTPLYRLVHKSDLIN